MKYIFPVIAIVALGLGILNALPNKVLGGQYNTNYAYFNGLTNTGDLVQTGDQTVSDDLAVSGSFCAVSGGVYYTLVPSTTPTMTTSTSSCL